MKKKFIIIGLAMGSLAFSQGAKLDSLNVNTVVLVDTTNVVLVDTIKKVKPVITSVQCNGTSKSTGNQCRLKTRHESGYCHHHRD